MARAQRRALRTAGLAGQVKEEKKEEVKEMEVIAEEVSDMEVSQLNSISMNDNEQIDFDRRGVPSRSRGERKGQVKTKTVVQRGISELYSEPSQLLGASDTSDLQISKKSESDLNLSQLAEEMKSVDERPSRNRGVFPLASRNKPSLNAPPASVSNVDNSEKSHQFIDYSMSVLAEELSEYYEESPKKRDISQLVISTDSDQSYPAAKVGESESEKSYFA